MKIQEGKSLEALSIVKDLYQQYESQFPFDYTFLSDVFESQYRLESLTGKLANIFSVLAIAISCLGLFGLASFLIEKRTREISIRKVLGASLNDLVTSISADFGRVFVLSIIVGSPIAYYLMTKYLQKFAYHVDFEFWSIGITAVLLLTISMATVIYHIIRAAIRNPAEVLRSE